MLFYECKFGKKPMPCIKPITFGQQQCMPLHTYGPAPRAYWLLHYVVSGRGKYTSGPLVHDVGSHQCFIIRPHRVITYQADEKQPWHYIWVGFECDGEMPELMYHDVAMFAGLGEIFADLMQAEGMEEGQEAFVCGRIWDIISAFTRYVNCLKNENYNYVRKAKSYIENYYQKKITVSQIADYVNLERNYFSSLFKKNTGVSPQRYLIDYRLEKAAELLMQDNMHVVHIARSVGYGNIVNFTKMFKKNYGCTPSGYKAMVSKFHKGEQTELNAFKETNY